MKSCFVYCLYSSRLLKMVMCKNLKRKNKFGTSMKIIKICIVNGNQFSFNDWDNLYYFHAWAKFTFFLNINNNTKKKKSRHQISSLKTLVSNPKFIFFNNFKRLIIMIIITILTVFSCMMKIIIFFMF